MHRYLDQAVWQWLGLGAIVAAAIALFAAFAVVRRRRPKTSRRRRISSRLLAPVAVLAGAYLLLGAVDALTFRGGVLTAMEIGSTVVQALAIAWTVLLICDGLADFVVESPHVVPGSLDAHFLRAGFRVLGIVAAAGIVAYAATQLGIPLIGVLAGLGVGGLAIALAAQPTIENFIGGVILYTDRPVRKDDWCKFGDMDGIVEEIGIRSTRIRALDGSLVTVPNADFAKEALVNYSACESILFEMTLSLRRETEAPTLRKVIAALRDMLAEHPRVLEEDLSVHLSAIGASSLDVELYCYVDTSDWDEFDAITEALLFGILERVESCGVALAMPSQTTYVAPDLNESGRRWTAVRAALAGLKTAQAG
jgi:MscS family membrane protein